MLDVLYVLVAVTFFIACWGFAKACDKL